MGGIVPNTHTESVPQFLCTRALVQRFTIHTLLTCGFIQMQKGKENTSSASLLSTLCRFAVIVVVVAVRLAWTTQRFAKGRPRLFGLCGPQTNKSQ